MKKIVCCPAVCVIVLFAIMIVFMTSENGKKSPRQLVTERGTGREDRWYVAATETQTRRVHPPESLLLHPSERTSLPLPLFLRDIMPDPSVYNIYLLVTSRPNTLSLRHYCSLESYCLENPDAVVWFLLLGMDSIEGDQLRLLEGMQREYPNLQLASLDLMLAIKDTPLESIVTTGRLNQSDYLACHTSDVLRLAVVSKAGGLYSDFDFICLRSVTGVRNSMAKELPKVVMNGLFHFDAGHPFLQLIMVEAGINFKPNVFSWNGPHLLTRLLKEYCRGYHFKNPTNKKSNLLNKIKFDLQTPAPFPPKESVNASTIASVHDPSMAETLCKSVKVLEPSTFMPVYWGGMEKMFHKGSVNLLTKVPAETYGIHFFNKITKKTVLVEDSALHVLVQRYCPQIHATVHNSSMTL